MSPSEIRNRLHQVPFKPFRVNPSDGKGFEIKHPENAMLTRQTLFVAVGGGDPAQGGDENFPERAVQCSLLHVTSIEELQAA